MPGCASIGGCDDSKANGGKGCYLCDVVAKLPQPKWKIKGQNNESVRRSETALTRKQMKKAKG